MESAISAVGGAVYLSYLTEREREEKQPTGRSTASDVEGKDTYNRRPSTQLILVQAQTRDVAYNLTPRN